MDTPQYVVKLGETHLYSIIMLLGIRRANWFKMNINRKWKQLIIKALQRISINTQRLTNK